MGQNQAYSDRIFPVTLFAVTIVLAVGGWSLLLVSHLKGVRIREGLQPTRHSTLALERGTSATGSESTCSAES